MNDVPVSPPEMDGRGSVLFPERRRPGRGEVSPVLLPLLRNPAGEAAPQSCASAPTECGTSMTDSPAEQRKPDSFFSSYELALVVAIGTALWAGVIATLGWFLPR